MAHPSNLQKVPFGAVKLCQDMANLVNNQQGSDIQFRFGSSQENETIHEPASVTLYAHSIILRYRSRYFATMLDEDKHWKEVSNGVIYKSNVSSSTFQCVLHYIYTGDIHAESSKNIIELITAAEEMDLEELSAECQAHLIRTVEYIFSDENRSGDENESRNICEGSINQPIPMDVAIRTHIIPALNLASSHSLSHLYQKLLAVILPNISMIIKPPDTYTTFVSGISSEVLAKIIALDNLAVTELDVWNLVLSWGCHQTTLSKAAVEECLSKPEDDEMDSYKSSNGTVISSIQLSQLKTMLTPHLPAIRFSLLDPDDYYHIFDILDYFIPRRRLSELHRFFLKPDRIGQLDMPRKGTKQKVASKIITNSTLWEFLRENIFKTGGISGCSSLNDLKFKLLFRASEHSFLARNFHRHCDDKGPTLVLVRSADGHLFGGVNFNHWKSDETYSASPLNFLFALPDGDHRKDSAIFGIKDPSEVQYSSGNRIIWGPTFGGSRRPSDLYIVDSANTSLSHSNLPNSYNGSGASKTALAGVYEFMVSDYEVFAIHKY